MILNKIPVYNINKLKILTYNVYKKKLDKQYFICFSIICNEPSVWMRLRKLFWSRKNTLLHINKYFRSFY